jgi:hypothetical protein
VQLVPHVRLEDDLGDAIPVAKINEQKAPEVAPGVDPAVQDDSISDVLSRQLATGMCSFEEHRSTTIRPGFENRQGVECSDTACVCAVRRLKRSPSIMIKWSKWIGR